MKRQLRPLAALTMAALIGAGCANGSAERNNAGTAGSTSAGARGTPPIRTGR
jgi:hypothetical protein